MSLLSKTDLLTEDGALYETHLDMLTDAHCVYRIAQSTNNMPHISPGTETVFMNRDQAIEIAKTILRNEGINVG